MVCVIKLNEVENLIESLDKEGFLGCVEVVNIEKIRVEGNLENILLKCKHCFTNSCNSFELNLKDCSFMVGRVRVKLKNKKLCDDLFNYYSKK
jgi:hypothetical protein